MDNNEALVALNRIRNRYNAIPAPKYKNAVFAVLQEDFDQLKNMKELLRDNTEYHKLISSIGKVLSRSQPLYGQWKNISERGANKSIRPTSRHNSNGDGYTEWNNKYGQQQAYIPGNNWSARHFMALDIMGYAYMLQLGGNLMPKTSRPIFNNAHDISLKDENFTVNISDKQFRQYSIPTMKSKDICQLLQEVSSSTFKLNYPVRLLFHKNGKSGEEIYSMPVFNTFFTLGAITGRTNKTYRIIFNTLLGQLFLHNLHVKNYDYIAADIYHLPKSAQVFYRRFILNNNYIKISVNLSNIIKALGYTYSNTTALVTTIKETVIQPLIDSGILASYTFVDGLTDKKFVLHKSSKVGVEHNLVGGRA